MADNSRAGSEGTNQYHLSERIKKSMASKLTLWFLLLSTVPLAVFFIFTVPHMSDEFMNITSEYMTDEARLFAAGVSFLDSEDEIISVIVATNDGNHTAFIIDKNGFYAIHPDKAKINTSMYTDFSAKTTEKILSNNEGAVIDENLIIGYSAMPAQDRIAVVIMKKTWITEKILSMENVALIQLSMSLILIALAGGVMIWFLVGPMYKLMKSAQEVGTGNLNVRIEPSEFDGELEILAITFKKMIDDLKKSRMALEEHSRTLEKQVSERTKDLEKSKNEMETNLAKFEKFNKLSVGRELKMIELKKRIKELESQVRKK